MRPISYTEDSGRIRGMGLNYMKGHLDEILEEILYSEDDKAQAA